MFKFFKEYWYLRKVLNKSDDNFLWSFNYRFLMGDQIIATLKIIDQEVLKSFRFGLVLDRAIVLKEKTVVITFLNKLGNLYKVPEEYDFDFLTKAFFEILDKELIDYKKLFFSQAVSDKENVKNKYNCHLNGIVTSVMHAIYNRRLPFIQ